MMEEIAMFSHLFTATEASKETKSQPPKAGPEFKPHRDPPPRPESRSAKEKGAPKPDLSQAAKDEALKLMPSQL